MSYSNEMILDALEASSISGGEAYSEAAGKLHPSDADIEVSTVEELIDSLNSSNEIIAIANDAELDLTDTQMLDLGSKTLVSYRGWDGQDGALIYTDNRGYKDSREFDGRRPYTLFYSDGNPRVTGLRIRGARYDEEFTQWDYDDNLARAIMLRGPGGEIDNCEIFGWTWNALHLRGDNQESIVTEAEVHHNHIHRSYQIGYGYGVEVWRGFGHVHHNYFDETRHSINGFGWWNSGYIAENNVFGPRQYSHCIDMHCLEENSANARVGDDQDHRDYDLRAGGKMVIRNNTFCMEETVDGNGINAISIRGVPWDSVWIENNRFTHPERPPYNSGNEQEGFAWRQVNVALPEWSEIPRDDEGYTLNWHDTNNQFGAPDTPWEPGLGAPIDIETGETNWNAVTIDGQGSTAYYTFTVDGNVQKSTAYGGTINAYDKIVSYDNIDTIVTGRTTNEPDSFILGGEITSFSISSPAKVSINGEEIDHEQYGKTIITISGRGSPAHYEFEFIGDVEKSTSHKGTINPFDKVHDSTVTGRTTNEPDAYVFSGAITDYSDDAPVDVALNGAPTGIWI